MSKKRRILVALLIGGIVFGAAYAVAATLTVTSGDLAAGGDTVDACNATASTSYTVAYVEANSQFEVADVVVSSDVACAGQTASVALSDGAAQLGGTLSGLLDGSGGVTIDFSGEGVAAADVTAVDVAITT